MSDKEQLTVRDLRRLRRSFRLARLLLLVVMAVFAVLAVSFGSGAWAAFAAGEAAAGWVAVAGLGVLVVAGALTVYLVWRQRRILASVEALVRLTPPEDGSQ